MNYKLILWQDAEKDLAQAYKWYNEKVPGLGFDFLAVVERVLESIQDNPLRFPVMYRKVRRALVSRFPFGIFFVTEEERVVVLAVMHTARDPAKWRHP
ncbi:MAG: type II toxin-antitoxin system RelE/ParE family toxin [Xanthomonadaceae bacterium]|nr:type II toxin-antitoxin system RelE/ParE family toxin [Xanthomonadaceae bacterium]